MCCRPYRRSIGHKIESLAGKCQTERAKRLYFHNYERSSGNCLKTGLLVTRTNFEYLSCTKRDAQRIAPHRESKFRNPGMPAMRFQCELEQERAAVSWRVPVGFAHREISLPPECEHLQEQATICVRGFPSSRRFRSAARIERVGAIVRFPIVLAQTMFRTAASATRPA